MWMVLFGCGVISLGALLALAFSKNRKAASLLAAASVWIGCVAAAIPVVKTLLGAPPTELVYDWYLPFGEFNAVLDGLSAFFLLPILLLAPLTALYGCGYLSKKEGVGPHYFFFNALIVSMMSVVVARDGILFLLAWEAMAISSFFLVVFDHALGEVRAAGWTYLVATHIGTAALLIFFAVLGSRSGSFVFDGFTAEGMEPWTATLLFGLAVFGFGAKAGVFPLHVWLPEAHPAAPSHVSALMSGVMIKMGVYGLLRALTFLGPPTAVWGWSLTAIGVASGILGVVSALAQHDMKRLLAYSSVENIGIIFIGIGAGVLGLAWQIPILSLLGFGGALLHVLNHSLFKGLLFLGAGAVLHETATRDMNRMGGLMKRMPKTAYVFLVGAAAASALPPFNGFVSEFLIYLAGVKGVMFNKVPTLVLSAGLLVSMALIGGLAAACFTKCFGLVFLGEPRETFADEIHDVSFFMRLPMQLLALLCLVAGLGAPLFVGWMAPGLDVLIGTKAASAALLNAEVVPALLRISLFALGLIVLGLLIFGLRFWLGRKRARTVEGVWDCGYAAPSVRMQYTPSSYSRPVVELFLPFLREKKTGEPVRGYFPARASLATVTGDWAYERIFSPLFGLITACLMPFRRLQHGRVHIYVVYIAVTLVVLLIWTAGD